MKDLVIAHESFVNCDRVMELAALRKKGTPAADRTKYNYLFVKSSTAG